MNPDQKTRLLIGTLAAAVVIVVGYGIFQAQESTPQSIVRQAAPEVIASAPASAPAPGAPLLRIQADSQVIAGSGDHKAAVASDVELASYEWSIQGGTLEGDARNPSITWTAGMGTEVVLTCTGTSAADKTGTASLRVILRQPPRITRFEAEPKVITEGSSAKLSWSAENTAKLTLSPSGQDLTKYSGPPMEVKPEKTTIYTLSATNSTGVTVTREVELKVVPPPRIATFKAEPVPGTPMAFVVLGEFKGGKAELKREGQVLLDSEEGSLRLQLADLKEGSTLMLTVTNEAGTYVSSTLTFLAQKK
jgi:hypothetical protein